MDLPKQKCEACRGDSPKITEDEISILHPYVSDWQINDDSGVNKLNRKFTFKSFPEALRFTLMVGEMSEGEGHHPLLIITWKNVTVEWWTHKIKGLHRNDFVMAAKTDVCYEAFS